MPNSCSKPEDVDGSFCTFAIQIFSTSQYLGNFMSFLCLGSSALQRAYVG